MIRKDEKHLISNGEELFRFNIRERLMRRGETSRMNVYRRVITISGRHQSTVKRVVYRKVGDTNLIDYEIVLAFSKVLGVSVEELDNTNAA